MPFLREAINKNKRVLFPKVENWSGENDHLRYRKDWWWMPIFQFVIFHKLGYKYFLFLTNAVGVITFGVLGVWWLLYWELEFLALIPLIVAIRMAWSTIQKVRTWKVKSDITFYDLFFREY